MTSATTRNTIPFTLLRIISCLALVTGIGYLKPAAQNCPPNIDFETGNFNGWTCHVGSVAAVGTQNVISLFAATGPIGDQHTMYGAPQNSGDRDYFGDFPVLCPNGSGHAVKLGNTSGGAQAEGLSYEFTIPSNRNTYSLIYNYAVVFQDPSHQEQQQPRLEIEVTDVTAGETISCSSFTFFPNGSPLPGFFLSTRSDSIGVWCKDWSAVTINLNGKAGRTIRLFFKTADCTFRRHFGYAYIDVNSECSSEFVGATYCPDDTAVSITAPYGYQNYTWYNNNFSQVLGNTQTISFNPPPATGTSLAVEIVPYDGYGCLDTLYANLKDTLRIIPDAGTDMVSCNAQPVLIGRNPKPGVVYTWSPGTGLSNVNISNPEVRPQVTTQYVLDTRSTGGGCHGTDTVIVIASIVDSSLTLVGKDAFCITSSDSAVLHVKPTDTIRWYRNGSLISGAFNPRYRAPQSGSYYAMLKNKDGCEAITRYQDVTIEVPRPGINYPVKYAVVNYPLQLNARRFGIKALWNPPVFLNDPAQYNPVFKSSSELDQLYTVDITTAGGCTTTDRQLVKTIKEVKVYVPNAFTPDNNGLNDFFKPFIFGIRDFSYFRVYNRWGQLVYDMNSSEDGWNGKLKNELQPAGVYVWIFQGVGLDDKLYTQKGTVTLIR